ncbi:MAG: PD40 domain-containing protein [Phycisphaerales bacterium]|nr:PD40 domain-containing protein [Phycisphaerales bacterium]
MNLTKSVIGKFAGLAAGIAVSHAGASDGYPGLIQYPSLSPDAQTIVFSAAGDLWAIDRNGGVASRLTAHPAIEGRSKFNAAGDKIAFESNRGGVANIFVADLSGNGQSTVLQDIDRVTTSDRTQWLGGFSADGESVLFSAFLYPEIYRQPRMYSAPINGGAMSDLTGAFGRAPTLSTHDDSIYFIRGYYYPHRWVYEGSGNLDIWKFDPADNEFTQMTGFEGNDLDPCPLPDGSMVYLSSKDGQYNVYRMGEGKSDRKGRNSGKQLTKFAPQGGEKTIMGGVRDLSVSADGSTAVFVVQNSLYTLDLNDKNAVPVEINLTLGVDSDRDLVRSMNVSSRVSEAAMHPSGDAVAVVARNELFVRSTQDEHPSRRITDTPVRERDIVWSPDGEVLYFTADDEESLGSIYAARVTLSSEDLLPDEPEEAEDEVVDEGEETTGEDTDESESVSEDVSEDDMTEEADSSDDSESEEAEVEEEAEEEKIDHAARWAGALRFEITEVVSGSDLAYAPTPSPDGTKLLYKRDRGDVILHDFESGEERVLFESWSDPEVHWASDSAHIIYSNSDLNFNSDIFLLNSRLNEAGESSDAINLTRHPDIDHSPRLSEDGKVLTFLSDRGSNNWEWDVYAINLDRDLDGMRRYELDTYNKDAVAAAKKRKPLDPTDPPEIDPLEFDVDDAYLRVRRLTSTPESEGNLVMSPAGDRIAFTVGRSFVSVDRFGQERKTIHSGSISDPRVSLDGSSVSFVSGGQAMSSGIKGGESTAYGINGQIMIDSMAELDQKFREASQRFGMNFYHPTLKGLDWDTITNQYHELVMQTRTNQAFQRIMNYMFGELDGSHTGIWGGDGFSAATSARNGYLGVDTTPVANGYKVERIFTRGAIDRMDDGVQVGDIIVAVGDQRVDDPSTQDLHNALAGLSGTEVLIEYLTADEETGEQVTNFGMVTPVSYSANSIVRYRQEVLDRQREVDEMSDGKLGYLHIRSMGEPSVRDFERDLFAAAEGKDGLVIDVRDNGGGWTTDILLASLTAPTHAYTIPRGANPDDVQPDSYPRDRRLIYAYSRPIVVLINENSFSNAEIFAHSIRTADRGRLVGVPTFGGVISTGSFSLIDGTTVRRPFRGWYLPDGTDMENNGAEPDVFVAQTPADEAAGNDPQLEAAVKDLLKSIK